MPDNMCMLPAKELVQNVSWWSQVSQSIMVASARSIVASMCTLPVGLGNFVSVVLQQQGVDHVVHNTRNARFRHTAQACVHVEQFPAGHLLDERVELRAIPDALPNLPKNVVVASWIRRRHLWRQRRAAILQSTEKSYASWTNASNFGANNWNVEKFIASDIQPIPRVIKAIVIVSTCSWSWGKNNAKNSNNKNKHHQRQHKTTKKHNTTNLSSSLATAKQGHLVAATLLTWSCFPNVESFCHARNICDGHKEMFLKIFRSISCVRTTIFNQLVPHAWFVPRPRPCSAWCRIPLPGRSLTSWFRHQLASWTWWSCRRRWFPGDQNTQPAAPPGTSRPRLLPARGLQTNKQTHYNQPDSQ